jgi:hypothetical protein
MNRTRLAIAGLTAAMLAGLLVWQLDRERRVRGCLDAGGLWDGQSSLCRDPLRPILQRDYHRS